jgi:chromosomal replication initiator protein
MRKPEFRTRLDIIIREVCATYDLTKDELMSQNRTRHIVRPRQIAMYLGHQHTLLSYLELGRRFSGRDHTTVMHAVSTTQARIGANPDLANEIFRLQKKLVQHRV